MIMRKLQKTTLIGLALTSAAANAIPEIPTVTGWSGHIGLGAGAGSSESNMLASISSIDLGDERVSGLDQSPDDEDIVLPTLPFEAAYTLADSGTQLFIGSRQARHFSLDVDTTIYVQFGARQSVGEVGVVAFSYVASTIATDVWKDPYLVDEERGDTERTSKGVQIEWGNIFGTPLEFYWSSREIEIDDERSGQDGEMNLTSDQQRALRRSGEVYRVELNYDWQINDRHSLVPGIGYIDEDLDGSAMAQDGLLLQLEHVYDRDRWSLVSKVYVQDLESDTSNPIYGDSNDVETIGGSVTAYYKRPFGLENWTANAGVLYYEGDSNNDFYDSSLSLFSLGMLYRF